ITARSSATATARSPRARRSPTTPSPGPKARRQSTSKPRNPPRHELTAPAPDVSRRGTPSRRNLQRRRLDASERLRNLSQVVGRATTIGGEVLVALAPPLPASVWPTSRGAD